MDVEKQRRLSQGSLRRWLSWLFLAVIVVVMLIVTGFFRQQQGSAMVPSADALPDDLSKLSHEAAMELARSAASDSTKAAEAAAIASASLAAKLDEAKIAADSSARLAVVAAQKKRIADRAAAAAAHASGSKARVFERKVRFTDGTEVKFSVFGRGNDDTSVFILPFNTVQKRFLLTEEYHPGPDSTMMGLVAGMKESKHADAEEAARWELSEEGRLKLGPHSKLIALAPDALLGGYPQDKYASAVFRPFLALDCLADERPRERDAEERIKLHQVTESELRLLMKNGRMNVPSTAFSLLALEYLNAHQLL